MWKPIAANHISEYLEAIEGCDSFFVADRPDGTKIINYHYAFSETFPSIVGVTDEKEIRKALLRRDCRGIIFDAKTGLVIRKPFHKFFNLGERPDTNIHAYSLDEDHTIYEKLDGSMIAPYFNPAGKLIMGTKMGETEISEQVKAWLDKKSTTDYVMFIHECLLHGYTPIFEWCSPYNRIVLGYKEENLHLTAIRNMITGVYETRESVRIGAEKYNVTVCPIIPKVRFTESFHKWAKEQDQQEGYVVCFDGNKVKIKNDWYCKLHRVKSDMSFERGVVSLILEEKIDDFKSLLLADDLAKLNSYEDAFMKAYKEALFDLNSAISRIVHENLSRKDFALTVMPNYPKFISTIIFQLWDMIVSEEEIDQKSLGHYTNEALIDMILHNCNKNVRFDEFKQSSGIFKNVPEWRPKYVAGMDEE